MFIKALLPLIAAIKYKLDHVCGEQFGEQIAQVYKACKIYLNVFRMSLLMSVWLKSLFLKLSLKIHLI